MKINNFLKYMFFIFLYGCYKKKKKEEKKIIEYQEILKDSGVEICKKEVVEFEEDLINAEIEMDAENFGNDDYNNIDLNNNVNVQSDFVEKLTEHEVNICYNFKLYYEYDVYTISAEQIEILKKIIEILNNEKSLKLEIISSASASEDLFISSNRLAEVMKFLVSENLDESRIYSKKDLSNNAATKEESERYIIINLVKKSELSNSFPEFCYN